MTDWYMQDLLSYNRQSHIVCLRKYPSCPWNSTNMVCRSKVRVGNSCARSVVCFWEWHRGSFASRCKKIIWWDKEKDDAAHHSQNLGIVYSNATCILNYYRRDMRGETVRLTTFYHCLRKRTIPQQMLIRPGTRFVDEVGGGCCLFDLSHWWATLHDQGPLYGYYVNPPKTWLVVK